MLVARLSAALLLTISGLSAQTEDPGGESALRLDLDQVVARVDGRDLTLRMYLDYVLRSEGTRKLDQFVNRILLERESRRLQVSIPYHEVDQVVEERMAELARIYRGDHKKLEASLVESHGSLDDYRRWLRDKLIWEAALGRCLLAARVVTPASVEREFGRRYGPGGVAVRLRHIQTGDEVTAERLRAELDSGAPFDPLLRSSEDLGSIPEGGVFLLHVREESLGNGFSRGVEKLTPGAARAVIRSRKGWHVVELLAREKTEFAKVRDALAKELEHREPTDRERRDYLRSLRTRARIEKKGLALPETK